MFVRVHHMQTTKYIAYWIPGDTSTAVLKLLDNFTDDAAAGALLMHGPCPHCVHDGTW
jgi:hypothetical protein